MSCVTVFQTIVAVLLVFVTTTEVGNFGIIVSFAVPLIKAPVDVLIIDKFSFPAASIVVTAYQ